MGGRIRPHDFSDVPFMEFFASLLPSVQHIGTAGYFVAFGIALAESLPFIGLMFPGTVLIVILGFFASQGFLRFGVLIWFVTAGAVLGDVIGYRSGIRGKKLFREGNRFLRPSYLEKGKKFFHVHGEKSIFLGRFVGPLRPIIPFVAGLSHMDWWRFIVWDVAVSLLWAWSHLTLGYFFGGAAAVIETWFTRASFFLLLTVAILFLLWFISKKLRPFVRVSKSIIRSMGEGIMGNQDIRTFMEGHPKTISFMRRRFSHRRFTGLPLTLFFLAAVYLVFLLSGIVEGIITAEPIISVDARVANLMYAFRDTGFIRVFLWITLLARRDIVILLAVIVSALAVVWDRRKYILPFLITLGGSQLFASLGKIFIHRPRPSIAYYLESSFSFPSGHAALSVALYGFVAYVLLRTVKLKKRRYRTGILFLTLSIIFAIGLSRLYLGVHFLSDVWGGYLLGGLWLIIGISIAEMGKRRRKTAKGAGRPIVKHRRFASAVLCVILVTWYVSRGIDYSPARLVVDRSVSAEVSNDVVGEFGRLGLPRYSETFSGTHQEPMSFIVVARDDGSLIALMDRAGWKLSDPVTVVNMIRLADAAVMKLSYPTAPMTPSFWNTQVHAFGFQKQTNAGTVSARHHARFWKTSIRTQDGRSVYVGTASFDVGIKWIITHRISPDIDTERDTLLGDLSGTGLIMSTEKIHFVDPVLGKNFSGDPFFTDGEAYVLSLSPTGE